MIRITQTEVIGEPASIQQLSEEFASTGCALLPAFLGPEILKPLLNLVAAAQFDLKNEIKKHNGEIFGTTLFAPSNDPARRTLHFILNRPLLFEKVALVAGISRPGSFRGRLHRTTPDSAQHIDWHGDVFDYRTLGLNINLSTEKYVGGLLQLRDANRQIRREIGQLAPGDAFLFKIEDGWQHRLTPVESGSRTVCVGWFKTLPDWQALAVSAVLAGKFLALPEVAR